MANAKPISRTSAQICLGVKPDENLKPIFHLATLFARREAKTRIRQRDLLTLVGEKIRREQVGSVPTFFSVYANKFAKWKTGFSWASHIEMICKKASSGIDSIRRIKLFSNAYFRIYLQKYCSAVL